MNERRAGKRRAPARERCRHRVRGIASAEYCVVTVVVVTVLFMPLPESGGQSAVEYVLDALRAFQRHTTYLLSLP